MAKNIFWGDSVQPLGAVKRQQSSGGDPKAALNGIAARHQVPANVIAALAEAGGADTLDKIEALAQEAGQAAKAGKGFDALLRERGGDALLTRAYDIADQIEPSPASKPSDSDGGFGAAARSGWNNMQQSLGSAVEGLGSVTGLGAVERWGAETAKKNAAEAEEAGRGLTQLSEVDGVGSAGKYAVEVAGQNAPQMGLSIGAGMAGAAAGAAIGSVVPIVGTGVGAVAGGLLGGLGVNIPMFYGQNRERQKESIERGIMTEMDEGAAFLSAIPQATLDTVTDRLLVGKLAGPLAKAGGGLLTRAAQGAGKGIVAEVPTEIGQQMIERAQAGLPLDDDEAIAEYTEAGVAAGLLGGGLGGVSGAMERGKAASADDPAAEPEQSAAAPEAAPLLALPPPTNGGTVIAGGPTSDPTSFERQPGDYRSPGEPAQQPAQFRNARADGSSAGAAAAPQSPPLSPSAGVGAAALTLPAGPIETIARLAPDMTPMPEAPAPDPMFPDQKPGTKLRLYDADTDMVLDGVFQREIPGGGAVVRIDGGEIELDTQTFDRSMNEAAQRDLAEKEALKAPEPKAESLSQKALAAVPKEPPARKATQPQTADQIAASLATIEARAADGGWTPGLMKRRDKLRAELETLSSDPETGEIPTAAAKVAQDGPEQPADAPLSEPSPAPVAADAALQPAGSSEGAEVLEGGRDAGSDRPAGPGVAEGLDAAVDTSEPAPALTQGAPSRFVGEDPVERARREMQQKLARLAEIEAGLTDQQRATVKRIVDEADDMSRWAARRGALSAFAGEADPLLQPESKNDARAFRAAQKAAQKQEAKPATATSEVPAAPKATITDIRERAAVLRGWPKDSPPVVQGVSLKWDEKDGGFVFSRKHRDAVQAAIGGGGAIAGSETQPAPVADSLSDDTAVKEQGTPEAAAPAAGKAPSTAKLREAATRAKDRASEDLGRDRNTNTARRARMAGNAEADAERRMALAKNAEAIADLVEADPSSPLAVVSSLADVERVESALRRARHERQTRNGLNYDARKKQEGEPFGDEDLRFIVEPSVLLRQGAAQSILNATKGMKGVDRRAIDRMASRGGNTFSTTSNPAEVDALANAIAALRKKGGKLPYEVGELSTDIANFRALKRMYGDDPAAFMSAYLGVRSGAKQKQLSPLEKARRELIGAKIPGFFETPEAVARRMAEMAAIEPGDRVLEPNGGLGRLASQAAAIVGKAGVDVVEINYTLREALRADGYNIVSDDFTEYTPEKPYDVILMNPPFEKRQDAEHVQRAYSMLAPGGRLVAIMGEGVFFGSDTKAQDFRVFLEENDGTSEKLPEGTFKESGTGTNTRLVLIEKPAAAKQSAQPAQNAARGAKPASEYGASNTFVTAERAEKARALIRAKLKTQVNSGIDPELLAAGIQIAAFHIEAGARRFGDAARAVADDLGMSVDQLRPYLRGWYNGARDTMQDSGLSIDGMDDADAVARELGVMAEAKIDAPAVLAASEGVTTQRLSSNEVASVKTDAKTFQYKDNGDESGVTERLQGVTDWDEVSAMGGMVYQYADGRMVVADGHQRLGLAKRLQANGVKTPWTVALYREADGYTPQKVRHLAALKNIREGSGTAIDAAKVLRDSPNDPGVMNLPPKSALVRDARALAKLSADAFGMVINEVATIGYGVAVGQKVADQKAHRDVLALLVKLKPANQRQAEMIAEQAAAETSTEVQTSLFGDEEVAESLYLERAKVLDNALSRIRQDRATFKVLADRAGTIAEEGNVLNQEANSRRVENDAKVQAYLTAEANRKGPISDALSAAARKLKAEPRSLGRIADSFLQEIRNPESDAGGAGRDGSTDDRAGATTESLRPEARDTGIERDSAQDSDWGDQTLSLFGDEPAAPAATEAGAEDGQAIYPTTFEPGAEGLDQAVIPGAEQSERQRITMMAEAKKREAEARMAQSKMRRGDQKRVEDDEGGLFGEPKRDLFDAPQQPAPAAQKAKTYPDARAWAKDVIARLREKMVKTGTFQNIGLSRDRFARLTTPEQLDQSLRAARDGSIEFLSGNSWLALGVNEADALAESVGMPSRFEAVPPVERPEALSVADQIDAAAEAQGVEVSNDERGQIIAAMADDESAADAVKEFAAKRAARGKSAKIEDFGEKIGGARKDVWSGFKEKMEEAEGLNIAEEPLSKSWPEPDYEKLIEGGIDPWTVAFIRAARDAVPRKPARWGLSSWAKNVKVLRSFANDLLTGRVTKERLQEKLAESESLNDQLGGKIALYEAVGHSKNLKELSFGKATYSVLDGVAYPKGKTLWEITKPRPKAIYNTMPMTLARGDTRDEALAKFKTVYASLGEADASKAANGKGTKFLIYSERGATGAKYKIGVKIGANYIDLRTGIEDVKEARRIIAEESDQLQEKLDRMRDIPNERRDENAPRLGVDHRSGADVTPQQFAEAFGFRGVEFGNWVEDARRQEDLNNAYDGLMDLASILDLPPKAISLNGTLGLAFGARGSGGKNPAAAHFEPGKVVINLTKRSGRGSLAHEWFHAMDNHFARKRERIGGSFITDNLAPGTSPINAGVRPEVIEAFRAVKRAIMATDLKKRSENIDKMRTSAYWGTGIEMHARAFESYVIAKLQDQSAANDYLANVVNGTAWGMMAELSGLGDSYPYLTETEIEKVRPAFDELFRTIETRETERGVEMYMRVPGKRPTYASRKVKNGQALLDWARKQGFTSLVSADKLHVTLAYSKAPIDASEVEQGGPIPPVTEFGKPKRLGDAIVLPIKGEAAKALAADWQRFMDAGASWDYDSFQPHVTISYSAEGQDLSGVEPFSGSIELGEQETKPLDEGYGASPASREPVANLTGNELGEWEDMRQLGKKAEAWYRENLTGKTVTNADTGWTITFANSGARKTTSGKGADLLRMVPALRAIMQNGKLMSTEGDNRVRGGIKAVHKFGATVELDGRPRDVIATVREGTDGKYHYSLSRDMSDGARFMVPKDSQTSEGIAANGQRPLPAMEGNPVELNLQFAEPSIKPVEVAAFPAISKMLAKEMQAHGLGGKISPRVVRGLVGASGVPILGRQRGASIEVNADAPDAVGVMRHEIIHALRDPSIWGEDYGLFTQAEWQALVKGARADAAISERVERDYADKSAAVRTEEKVAELYREWAGARDGAGQLGRIFAKVRALFRALASGLRGEGFTDAALVMDRIASGKIGGRGPQGPGGGRRADMEKAAASTESPEFKRWFGKSKVVDASGKPMMVYHGTAADFEAFSPSKVGTGGDSGFLGSGFYFGNNSYIARSYSMMRAGGNERVIDAYLSLQNPFMWGAKGLGVRGFVQEGDRLPNAIHDEVVKRTGIDRPVRGDDVALAEKQASRAVREVLEEMGYDGVIAADDFSDRPIEFVAFRPEQIKSVFNRGTWNPDDPRLSEMRASLMQTAAKAKGMIGREHWRSPSEWLTDAMGGFGDGTFSSLALVPGRALFSELGKRMVSARSYLRTKEEMDALRNDWHSRADKVAQGWMDLRRKNAAANDTMMDLMHRATLSGIDPASPLPPADAMLKRARAEVDRFGPKAAEWAVQRVQHANQRAKAHAELSVIYASLPTEFKDLYRKVLGEYSAIADDFDRAVIENIENATKIGIKRAEREYEREMKRLKAEGVKGVEYQERADEAFQKLTAIKRRGGMNMRARIAGLRKVFESNRLQGAYVPLARFGDYFVTVRNAEGEVTNFSRFESVKDQLRFAREQEESNPGRVQKGVISEKGALRSQVDPNFVADVESMLAESGATDDVMDAVWQRWLETLPDTSIRTSKIHRKGRAGWNRDAFRAFGKHMFHGSHQLARLKYGIVLEDLMEEAELEAKRADDPNRAGLVVREMQKRHAFVMNPTGSAAVSAVSSLAFIWYLGATPAAALANISQTTIVGVPVLAARFKQSGAAGAIRELGRAAADFAKGKGHIEKAPGLTDDEQSAMAEAYRRGTIDKTQAHDLASVAETGIEYNAARERIMRMIGAFFHHAERLNREVTFLAAYRLAKADGLTGAAAVDAAADATWKTHFDYQNTSRPRVMQNDLGKILTTFRQFTVNMLWRLFRDVHQSVNGATKEERAEAKTQLIGITLSLMAHAGIRGTWGYGLLMLMLGMFFPGGDDDAEKWLQDALLVEGDSAGTAAWNWTMGAALNGVPGQFLNVDLKERIGMPNLWFRGQDRDLEGADLYSAYVGEVLGPVYGIGSGIFRGASYAADGEVWRGIETAVPKVIRDAMKAGRYATEGATTMNGDTLVENVNPYQVLLQASGFTPAQIAERYEINNRLKNGEKRIMDERKGLHKAAGDAARAGEPIPADVIEAIQDFNVRYPEYPITADTIRQSVRSRQRASERNEFGVSLNPKLNDRLRKDQPPAIYQ